MIVLRRGVPIAGPTRLRPHYRLKLLAAVLCKGEKFNTQVSPHTNTIRSVKLISSTLAYVRESSSSPSASCARQRGHARMRDRSDAQTNNRPPAKSAMSVDRAAREERSVSEERKRRPKSVGDHFEPAAHRTELRMTLGHSQCLPRRRPKAKRVHTDSVPHREAPSVPLVPPWVVRPCAGSD